MIDFVFSRGMLGFIISCIVLGIVIGLYKIIVWETRIGIWGKVINQEEKEKFLNDIFTTQIGSTEKYVDNSGYEIEIPIKIEISTPLTRNQKWKVYKIPVETLSNFVENKVLIYKTTDKELELEMSKKQ